MPFPTSIWIKSFMPLMSYYFWTAPNMVDKRMMILVVTLTLCGSRLMSLAPTAPRHDNWIIISSPTLFLLPYQREKLWSIVPSIFSNDLQISNRWADDKTLTSGEPWRPAKWHVLQCRACFDIKVCSGFIIQDSHALSFDTIPLFNY